MFGRKFLVNQGLRGVSRREALNYQDNGLIEEVVLRSYGDVVVVVVVVERQVGSVGRLVW